MSRQKAGMILTICLVFAAVPALAQETPAQQGINAFNEGNYEAALEHFRRAEQLGNESDSLQYNIAVSLYRLGEYEEARERFLALEQNHDFEVLARYNLALVAEALGDRETARHYYILSTGQQVHERVQEAASRRLAAMYRQEERELRAAREREQQVAEAQIGQEGGQEGGQEWAALASFSGGWDSNATSLAEDLIERRSSADDLYHEQLMYGHWQMRGRARDGFRLFGLAFHRDFLEYNHLDSLVVAVGGVYERPFGPYQAEAGFRINTTQLDLNRVAEQYQMHTGVSRQLPEIGTVGGKLSVARFQAGGDYRQIMGQLYRLELNWDRRLQDIALAARYRFDINDRKDMERNGAFASYSPLRHELRLDIRKHFSDTLSAGWRLEHRFSRYSGTNRLRDTDGRIREQTRKSHRNRSTLDVDYRFMSNWRFKGEYQYTERLDNFSLYTYDKHRISGTAEYRF